MAKATIGSVIAKDAITGGTMAARAASIATTERYLAVDDDEIRAAMMSAIVEGNRQTLRRVVLHLVAVAR